VQIVTLFVPALLWPRAVAEQDAPAVPALKTLLSRGDDQPDTRCEDEAAWLCEHFGVARQTDWPSAPVAVFGAGMPPGKDFWLHADPVHLQVHRDRMVLVAPEALALDDAESISLCAALNRHFEADRFMFIAPHPQRWYLRTGRTVRINTRGLSRVVGEDIDRLLPEGEERLAWHRVFNEVQMLLHDHPVNAAREERGVLPVNSLWFSGGGTLPTTRAPFTAVIGTSALVQGLAKLSQIPFTAAAQRFGAIESNDVLVELTDPLSAYLRQDYPAWKSAVEELERDWFAPLLDQVKSGRMRQLDIATVVGGRGYRWAIRRPHLWRWWRRPTMPGIGVKP
jgi:hypothetical protein